MNKPTSLGLPTFFLLLFLSSGCSGNEEPELSLTISSDSLLENSKFFAEATSTTPLDRVVFRLGPDSKSFSCNSNPCNATAAFYPKAGVYTLQVTAQPRSGGHELQASRRITVTKSGRKCIDSTPFGSCSGEKPLFCENGKLLADCLKCGCGEGYHCSDNNCIPTPVELAITSLDYPHRVMAHRDFAVQLTLAPGKAVAKGASYKALLIIGGKIFSKEFVTEKTMGGEEITLVFDDIQLPEGIHDLNVAVFAVNAEPWEAGSVFEAAAITSLVELEAPEAPSIKTVFSEGDDAVITWTAVSSAAGYRVYKSSEANAAFISYKLAKTVQAPSDTVVLQALEPGAHFFVVTAVDAFGNESAFSSIRSVTIK